MIDLNALAGGDPEEEMAEIALWSRDISERDYAFEWLRRIIEQRQKLLITQIKLLIASTAGDA